MTDFVATMKERPSPSGRAHNPIGFWRMRDKTMIDETLLARLDRGGGLAFPSNAPFSDGSSLVSYGMTLRDWFAGQALAGFVDGPIDFAIDEAASWRDRTARTAYAIADAMLAERAK